MILVSTFFILGVLIANGMISPEISQLLTTVFLSGICIYATKTSQGVASSEHSIIIVSNHETMNLIIT